MFEHLKHVQLQVKGLSEAKVDKMREAGSKIFAFVSFKNAKQLQIDRERSVVCVSTGSKQLDDIMGGGVQTGVCQHAFCFFC